MQNKRVEAARNRSLGNFDRSNRRGIGILNLMWRYMINILENSVLLNKVIFKNMVIRVLQLCATNLM
jgi:hypothetical protein